MSIFSQWAAVVEFEIAVVNIVEFVLSAKLWENEMVNTCQSHQNNRKSTSLQRIIIAVQH